MMEQLSIFDLTMSYISVDKPIRLIELFSGVGSQAMALRDLGADFEHYRSVEFDEHAVRSYNAIHGTNFPVTDIRNVHGTDLGIIDKDKYSYLLTYSFPCLTAETLVLTKRGYVKIKDVKEGDYVLTHKNTYNLVEKSLCTGNKNVLSIKGMCIDEIMATDNHRFYVRDMKKKCIKENGKSKRNREFSDPYWIECKYLTKNQYLGVSINQENIVPNWDGIDFEWTDGRSGRHENKLDELMNNHSFWWVIGRYVGDGWQRTQGGIIISNNKKRVHEVFPHLRNCNINYQTVEQRTSINVIIPMKEMQKFVEPFGRGAAYKRIPGFVFSLPINLIKSFLDGYMSADGCYLEKTGLYKATSISRELIYGIAQLVAKAYKTPYRIYRTKRPDKCVIEGRTVNQRDTYECVWKNEKKKQDKAFYEDGYVWFPIQSIERRGKEPVYDISVENAHSFTANGVIVHNCQDLSAAGKRKGMKKGSGTRSGLLWEVERLLRETPELPDILLMENVPEVIGTNNIKDFHLWQDFLVSKGYTNYVKILNAKDYGVAQNRNRCFMVSLLGEYNYHFPEPIPLTKCIDDYCEDIVDESYYINTEKAQNMIKKAIEDGKIEVNKTDRGIELTSRKDNIGQGEGF